MLNRALFTFLVICLSNIESFAQVLGVPLYSWDFSAGLPSTWSNGSNSNIGVWEYRGPNTVPSNAITSRGSCAGGSSAFNSLTQSNGFMIFDSNYWDDNDNQCGGFGTGPDPGPHTAWLISNSFSLAGVTGAVVTYQQQFRNYSSTIKVQYSINGGTSWVDMLTQSDFPSATAEWKSATFPAGAIGQTNVKLRFLYSGSYYHWAIDDITVYKPSINNLSVNSTRYTTFGNTSPVPPNDFHDLPYDRYPKTMIVPFKFNAKATNIGSATQTNTNLNVKVLNSANTVLYNQTTANSNVTAGATGNYTLTTGFTPSVTTGYFRIAYQINQTQTDEAPLNNRDTLDYFITDYQYARDEGPMEDEFTPSALYAGQTHQVGNIFEGRSNTVKCTSIAVAVGPGTAIGATIQAKIYKNDFTNLQATSVVYPVNAWDINAIGQQKLITLQLPTPLTLFADSVYIVMVGNTVGTEAFKVCRSGAAIDQTSFVRYPENNGLFFMAKMPVVRMNLFTAAQTPGCTNPLANNYLSIANIDDGSCDIPGCIYPSSSNYNPNATWYDGSCVLNGCTIPTACNYSPIATVNDGSCILPVTYYADGDVDTFGSSTSSISACSQPSGYVTNSLDCNDNNNAVNPLASEICNTSDDDCDGLTNEGLTFMLYFIDSDSDGYGNPNNSLSACLPPSGYVLNSLDCNDANALIKPGATELCNLVDDNCNGQINEGLIFVNYYIDTDLDGYGAGTPTSSCTPLFGNYVTNNLDCNNNNASIRPNAVEICNSIDDNCNNLIDDGLTFLNYYVDTDNDGFGAGTAINSCSNPGSGYVTNNSDCNNNNVAIRPTASEICNNIDDNCNNSIDEGLIFLNYYLDLDHDGYYLSVINGCVSPGSSYTTNGSILGDCNDNNFNINSGATEICGNLVDENCDGFDAVCIILGCTNSNANNFDPLANQDNGSCIILGCTEANAANYNPQANSDDNSCIYFGCIDPFANNYNPTANANDFSCEYNTATISISSSELCLYDSILVYNQTQFNENDNCIIDFGDGTTANYCNQTYYHQYSSEGQYVIQFIYQQGNSASIASSDTLFVHPVPTNFTSYLEFPNIVVSSEENYSIEWFFNGTSVQNYNPTLFANELFLSDGFYKAKLKNEFGCVVFTDSVYYLIPKFQFDQQNPCGPNEVIFENTTFSNQAVDCYFTNSSEPSSYFDSPYTYFMGAPETISVALFCSAFGNTYYSIENAIVESFPIPITPILNHFNTSIEATNIETNSIEWYLAGIPLNLEPLSQTISTVFNNSPQNGTYSAVFINEYGCVSDTASIFIIDINATATVNQGCYPFSTTVINSTSLSEGIQCEILFPGIDYLPLVDSIQFTFQDPGIYQPQVYCYSGIYSSSYNIAPITVFSHPETPLLTSTYGQVSITNNSAGNSVSWSLDGNQLNLTTNSISTFLNGIYDNGYYTATFTDINGCATTSEALLVIQPSYETILGAGCSPLNVILLNTTDPVSGMNCLLSNGTTTVSVPDNSSATLVYTEIGNFAPELTCSVGTTTGIFSENSITVFPDPTSPTLSYNLGNITALDVPSSNSIQWFLNGVSLNNSSNPLDISDNQLNGYFYATVTNENGCSTNSDSLLQIFPTFSLSATNGCAPLSIVATNTTPVFDGMNCTLQTNNVDYSFNNTLPLNYSTDGIYSTSITCSNNGNIFTATGPTVTVFPNGPTPILSSAYGAVLCSNCTSLSTQYYLDNIAFAQGTTAISTLQNGNYQNGYYSAQSTYAQGCLSAMSPPLLVVQPVLNFSPSEGCAPLQVSLVNGTDFITGLTCELFLGNGNGNIPLSYQEAYNYTYLTANTYSPYLSCTVGNLVSNSPASNLLVHAGTTPELSINNGIVTCINCINQDNTIWTIDGTLSLDSVSSVPDSIGTFFSCDYINEFGCDANSFIVGEQDLPETSFEIFPNPANESISITGLNFSSIIEIRDTQGRIVLRDTGMGGTRIINTHALANGFYTITETSTKTFRSGTLLVRH